MSWRKVKDRTVIDPYSGYSVMDLHRDYWVQKRPYKVPLPYSMLRRELISFERNWFDHIGVAPPVGNLIDYDFDFASGDGDKALNSAYQMFQDSAKDSAQNANNVLEMKGAVSQIVSHVRSLGKSIEAARHLDFPGIGKALGVTLPAGTQKRWRKRAKLPADAWLEYHFGWEPLVKDIGSSIDILQGTGKSGPHSKTYTHGHSSSSGSRHTNLERNDYFHSSFDVGHDLLKWKMSVRMGSVVTTTNQNLALANQMGFVNPLSVVWEAVPFSFVVDWFGNVGQCLGAMTDSVGFGYENAWTTQHNEKSITHVLSRTEPPDYPGGPTNGYEAWEAKAVTIRRGVGILGPTLHFGLPSLGIPRAATAISLLVQQMNKL